MARGFNGTTSTLTRADQAELQIPFPMSVGFWWAGPAPGAFNYILSKVLKAGNWASYALGMNTNNRLRFMIGWGTGGGTQFTVTPDQATDGGLFDGGYHYVCATYDGTTMILYIDGVSYSSTAENRAIAYSSESLFLGSFDGTQLFAAATGIAELSLWNVALTTDDIRSLAVGFSPELVRPSALVAHWELLGQFSPEIELRKGMDLTVTGGLTFAHPRIMNAGVTRKLNNHTRVPMSQLLGVAGETDTALPVTRTHQRALGVATETDTALAFARLHTRSIGVAAETDTALALARVHRLAVGVAAETDTALAITGSVSSSSRVHTTPDADYRRAAPVLYRR